MKKNEEIPHGIMNHKCVQIMFYGKLWNKKHIYGNFTIHKGKHEVFFDIIIIFFVHTRFNMNLIIAEL